MWDFSVDKATLVLVFFFFIIIIITCDLADTRWQGSFTYYIMYAMTMKVDYLTVQVGRATCEACSGNLEVSGTIPAFAVLHRETKKNLCRDGRSQDLPVTDL